LVFLLVFFIAYAVMGVVDEVFLTNTVNLKKLPFGKLLPGRYVDLQAGIAVLLFRPIMAIPALWATVRRLHDVGRSWWLNFFWVLFVPLPGWLWLILWMLQSSHSSKSP